MRINWHGSVGVGVAAAGLSVAVIAPALADAPRDSLSRKAGVADSVEFDVRSRIHEQAGTLGKSRSEPGGTEDAAFLTAAERLSGSSRPRFLEPSDDMWVFDFEYDPADDSPAYPELRSSAMGVVKTLPDELVFSLLAQPATVESFGPGSWVSVDIDVNEDQDSDYFTVAPKSYMALGTFYSSAVYRYTSDSASDTGYRARWRRNEDGWVASVPWRAMKLRTVGFYGEIKDQWGDSDYSPNNMSTYVNLPNAVPKATQSVQGSVLKSTKTKLARRVSLPAKTSANRALRWTSSSPRHCTVSGTTLRLTGRKGSCVLAASAPADDWYNSVKKSYSIRLT